VVDVDAGHNERHWPRVTVATCNDEATATRIASMLNGEAAIGGAMAAANVELTGRLAQQGEILRKALDTRNAWEDEVKRYSDALATARAEIDELKANREDGRNACAALRDEIKAVRERNASLERFPADGVLVNALRKDCAEQAAKCDKLVGDITKLGGQLYDVRKDRDQVLVERDALIDRLNGIRKYV
jgi:chromosome segregation ATPase